jgi:hypothetical protein
MCAVVSLSTALLTGCAGESWQENTEENTLSTSAAPIHLKLNLGGDGAAPAVPGWTNVWGQPYVDANLSTDVDFGDVGAGIGLRCINDGSPNAWGENIDVAAHNLGKETGNDSGVYPDLVLKHGWFTKARTGTIELYNHSGTPLSGKTFTVRMLGSRRDLTQPRTSLYTVNGVSLSQDVDDNTATYAEFTGVSAIGGVITITVTNTTPSDTTYAYLNAIEVIEEGVPPPAGPSPSRLYFDKFTSGGVQKDVLVYVPPGYDDDVDDYPVIFFYHGEGGKGVVQVVTNQAVGTGNGTQTSFSGNFVAPPQYYRVLHSSVSVKVNGVEVARGRADGSIEGASVSGTMDHQSVNGAFTIEFDAAPANGAAVTIAYQRSEILETGLPSFLNLGDEPPGVIILAPQITSTDYSPVNDFDHLKAFADAEFRINPNRVYLTGLSRGGRGTRRVLIDRYAQIAATITGTADYTDLVWANYTNVGTMWLHGTADSTLTDKTYDILSLAGAESLNISPRVRNFWGVGHSAILWNTNLYNRKERTDAPGTADFDYVRWLKKHSIDLNERAELFVEHAEHSGLIEDHREAMIQVNLLPAGAHKTALLARLSNLKAAIDGGGRRFLIDLGVATHQTPGYNNLTSCATGQSISGLVDDESNASSHGFTVVTQSVASNQQALVQSNRGNGTYFGLAKTANADGCVLGAGTGIYKLTGLDDAKTYSLRFHHNEGSPNFTAKAEISIKIGATTKTQYSAGNTLKYIEFQNLVPSSGQIQFEAKRNADRDVFLTEIELFENPSSGGGGGEKLTLTPAMVVQESGAGDAGMLVDEQALAGDPRDGLAGQPTQSWLTGTQSSMPANAYIDLGEEVDLTDIYLFDTNGNDSTRNDEWVVSVGTPGNWTEVATETCDTYLTWKRHTVAVRTRYVRLTNRVAYVRIGEVVLYAAQ